MTFLEILLLLLIACICGSIAQALVGYSSGGCLMSIVLGFIGALIGAWLARQLGMPELLPVQIGGTTFPIIWSVIGGALFVALLSLISGRRRRAPLE
ncbi:MAG: GlsB/YeaQ/YmgE family stress response membrane protein [Pirellulaceae bacterium]